jgi:acetaldehyde dehydrogenase
MKIKAAIIGTGNIGTDLCSRLVISEDFEVMAFIGRRIDSEGLRLFRDKIPGIFWKGDEDLWKVIEKVDCVFDATSASDHKKHWKEILERSNKLVLDLTPSKVGKPMVPILESKLDFFNINKSGIRNFSMVTCGGQSAAAVVYAIARHSRAIESIEVSSSIASKSAGPATRRNIDEYISATENLIGLIANCDNVKAVLVLNPIEPPVMMRTTVHVSARAFDLKKINEELSEVVFELQKYVPGYEVVVPPHESYESVISATVKVVGAGYYLPKYSGNLDIINSAAVETAKRFFKGI